MKKVWLGLVIICLLIFQINISFALPNPSAVYCEKLGYKYKIVETSNGQEGLCIISDNLKLNAWDFFKGKVGQNYSYCAKIGFDIKATDKGVVCVPKFLKLKSLKSSPGFEGILMTKMMNLDEKRKNNFRPYPEKAKSQNKQLKTKGISIGTLTQKPRWNSFVASTGANNSFDWRNKDGKNWMTSVKDQGKCGSCWAFSAVGAVEAKYNINQNNSRLNPDLSEEYLVSCDNSCYPSSNQTYCQGGCSGGYLDLALGYIKDSGISDENCFSYTATNGSCDKKCADSTNRLWTIGGVNYSYYWTGFTNDELEDWIIDKGPLSVAIYMVDNPDSDGFINCSAGGTSNHGVILVGYNDTGNNATSYWIIKNSWDANWSLNGYFKIRFDDNCNVGDEVYYVNLTNPPDFKPTITLHSPEQNHLTNNPVEFNFTVINRVSTNSTCDLIIDGLINQTNFTVSNNTLTSFASNLSEGIHNWSVTCWENGIGVPNSSETRTLNVDLTVPFLTINSPTSNSYINSTSITINLTVTDTNINYTNISIYNSTGDLVNSTTNSTKGNYLIILSVPSDGIYNITAITYDLVGHNSTTTSINITVDTTPPIINLINSSFNISNSTPEITFNFTDVFSFTANCTLYFNISAVNNLIVQNNTNTILSPNNSQGDGNYEVYFICTDLAGNTDESNKINVTIDTTPPVIDFLPPTTYSGIYSQNWILANVTTSDFGVGLDTINISLYNSSNQLINSTSSNSDIFYNFTDLNDGNYSLCVTANDTLGNRNQTNLTIILDTTEPKVIINLPTNNQFINSKLLTINLSVEEINLNYTNISIYNSTGNLINSTINNTNGNYTLFLSVPSDGIYNITATGFDLANNSKSTNVLNITVDTTKPTILNISINGKNISTNPNNATVITHENGTVNINWTVIEKNLNYTSLSIDGGINTNSSDMNGTNIFNTNLSAGLHKIVFLAIDKADNLNSTPTYYFKFNRRENITEKMDSIESDSNILDAILKTANGTNFTGLKYLNKTVTLELEFNVSGTRGLITIPNFTGLDANWNRTDFNSLVNISSTQAVNAGLNAGTNFTTFVLLINATNFLNPTNFDNGASIFINQSIEGLDVFYIADDAGEEIYKLSYCPNGSRPNQINLTTMCYVNTSTNVTLYVQHLSGGGLANDTIPPTLNITDPVNNTVMANSYFNFTFTAKEANPNPAFCWFNLTNGTDTIENGTITNESLIWIGTSGTYTQIFREIGKGNYNLTLNCTDLNNQSTQIYHNFTVNDITQPEITNISTITSGTGTSTVTITLSVTTDKYAVCRYSTLPNTTFSNMTNNISTTETTNHSVEIFYTSDSLGTYYVRCNDTVGNVMNSSNSTIYNADVTVDNRDSSSGNGGSSGSFGGGYVPSYWITTYTVTDENFTAGYSRELKEKQRLRVQVNNETHYIGIVELTNTTIKINISSTPQQATFLVGDEKKFEVTNDVYYDIYIRLDDLINDTANITIKKIHNLILTEHDDKNQTVELDEPETQVTCSEGKKKCLNDNLQECTDNNWITIETCESGCNETTLTCNSKHIGKIEKPINWMFIIVTIVVIIVLVGLGYYFRIYKKK